MPIIYQRDDDEEPTVSTDDGKTIPTPVSPKVYSSTGAGAALLALGFILRYYGVDVPDSVIGAVAVVGTFVAGYATPDRLREYGAVFKRGTGEHRA